MRAIETLFRQLQLFIASGTNPDPASLRALANATSIARSTLQGAPPIRYRTDMWLQDGPGKWRKCR